MVARSVSTPNLLELRAALGISRERMARLFDVTGKTIERWEQSDRPPASAVARTRLAKLREIVELGLIVYTPEGFQIFMTTPMPVFKGRTALQLIEGCEADTVFDALAGD